MRYAARTDENQKEIVQALRDAGYIVWLIKWPVDLLVGYPGGWLPMEVKRAKGWRITDDQTEFFKSAPGPYALVNDAESAIRAVKARM